MCRRCWANASCNCRVLLWPVFFLVDITGHHPELEEKLLLILSEGARMVLHKPLDVAELLATVERLTTGHEVDS
jgi:DNA-binding response OmpR family regulator